MATPGRKAKKPYTEAELRIGAAELQEVLSHRNWLDDHAIRAAISTYLELSLARLAVGARVCRVAAELANGASIKEQLAEFERFLESLGIRKRFVRARVETVARRKRDRMQRAVALYHMLGKDIPCEPQASTARSGANRALRNSMLLKLLKAYFEEIDRRDNGLRNRHG